jgi:hypothetical protein
MFMVIWCYYNMCDYHIQGWKFIGKTILCHIEGLIVHAGIFFLMLSTNAWTWVWNCLHFLKPRWSMLFNLSFHFNHKLNWHFLDQKLIGLDIWDNCGLQNKIDNMKFSIKCKQIWVEINLRLDQCQFKISYQLCLVFRINVTLLYNKKIIIFNEQPIYWTLFFTHKFCELKENCSSL